MRANEGKEVAVQRTRRALAVGLTMGVVLGLGGAVRGGAVTPSAAPSDQSSPMTFEGTKLPPGTSTGRFASCSDVGYIERGADQTVPRLTVVDEPDVYVGPFIAWDTVPNAFGSWAATSAAFWIHNVDTSRYHNWKVTLYCTPDKSKAWLVFG